MTDMVVHRDATPGLPTGDEIDRLGRLANALGHSGMFKDARGQNGVAQAMTKMVVGASLGLSPAQAMTALHVFDGKIELSANLQAAMVREHPDYDYRIDRLDDEGCTLTFLRSDGTELGQSTFTLQDAAKAGLANKNNWLNYPRNMTFARAMSNGVAWFCPDVTLGIRVYSPGEVSDDEQPPVLDAAPVEAITVEPLGGGDSVTVENAAVEPETIDQERADKLNDQLSEHAVMASQVKQMLAAAGVPNAEQAPPVALKALIAQLTVEQADALQGLIDQLPQPAEAEVA